MVTKFELLYRLLEVDSRGLTHRWDGSELKQVGDTIVIMTCSPEQATYVMGALEAYDLLNKTNTEVAYNVLSREVVVI